MLSQLRRDVPERWLSRWLEMTEEQISMLTAAYELNDDQGRMLRIEMINRLRLQWEFEKQMPTVPIICY